MKSEIKVLSPEEVKTINSSLLYIKEVRSPKQAKRLTPLRGYRTKNYDMLRVLSTNRGATNGVNNNRVKKLEKLIADNDFVFAIVHVLVNKQLWIIDGHHHLALAKKYGLFVIFTVSHDPKFNDVSEREFANNVSMFNSFNTNWTDRENLTSAYNANEPTSKLISKYRELATERMGTSRGILTANQIVGLINNFKNGNINAKELRAAYCNDDYADILRSDEFKAKYVKIVEFMYLIKTNMVNTRPSGVVKTLILELNKVTEAPNWDAILIATKKYIKKYDDTLKGMGDRQGFFNLIVHGIITIMLNK